MSQVGRIAKITYMSTRKDHFGGAMSRSMGVHVAILAGSLSFMVRDIIYDELVSSDSLWVYAQGAAAVVSLDESASAAIWVYLPI